MSTTSSGSARNFIPMQHKYDRVVLLVDMDCFYCQVEEKLNPELKGQPLAVVQYNAWRGGGIIAVNYAARARGVTRHMRGDEAKEHCPEIQLAKVPNIREKADLSKYRDAGKEVANVLQRFTTLLERASVDEAYLDITEAVNKRLEEMNSGTFMLQPEELINTYAVGYERIGDFLKVITSHFANPYACDDYLNTMYDAVDVPAVRQSDVRLLLGASIASEIRAEVKKITSYECSAGIAHNKILAKLACGMNKPNKQTILPLAQVGKLFETLPVGKIKGLGAKYGEEVCERLKIRFLGQMLKYTEGELQKMFDEKNGTWLYNICRGIDLEAVTPRFYSKSIGCCKKFPGRNNITGLNTLKHWLKELATEISERLEKDVIENNRKPKQMTVSYIQELDNEEVSSSRSVPLTTGSDQELLAQRSFEVIKANTKQFLRPGSEGVLNNPIKFLGISVGKFETTSNNQNKLQEMFANQASKALKRKSNSDCRENESVCSNIVGNEKPDISMLNQEQKDNKYKGFFAKYLKNQDSKEIGNKKEESSEMDDVSSKAEDTQNANKSTPHCNDIDKSEDPRNMPQPNDTTRRSKSNELQSFFLTALSKQNGEIVPKEASHPASTSVNPYSINYIECDDIFRLEAELKAIAAEENVHDVPTERIKDDSNGSPQKKKMKPSADISLSIQTNENTFSKYEMQYAEFAVPELRLDLLEFQRCDVCGAKIPVEERAMQMHRDHHFAQQLSQQQREEFRAEFKSKVSQKQSVPQKNKSVIDKKPSKSSGAATTSITKFLQAKVVSPKGTSLSIENEEPQASTSAQCDSTQEEMLPCSDCNILIKKSAIEEHKDYHLAKKLQRELNNVEVHTVVIPKKTQSSSRKAFSGGSQGTSSIKPINQFFTQSQS